jgi:Carboxypeptidase regulatory-like domain
MVKLRRKLIVVCGHMVLLSMALCRMVSAQSGATAALSGTIADSSGAVVPGASITLTFTQSGAERKIITGGEGAFAFFQLSTGEYRTTVDAAGFRSIAQKVIYEGAPIHLNLVLSAAAAHTEVVVTATDADPTQPAHVNIAPEQIERMPTGKCELSLQFVGEPDNTRYRGGLERLVPSTRGSCRGIVREDATRSVRLGSS